MNIVIEVKSNAKGNDLKKFNEDIRLIKDQNPECNMPLFGIFCYRVDLTAKTIFERFGFQYDRDNDLYQQMNYDPSTDLYHHSDSDLMYPEIDFFLSIDNTKQKNFIFFRKAFDRENNQYYVSLVQLPITRHLWSAIKGCI